MYQFQLYRHKKVCKQLNGDTHQFKGSGCTEAFSLRYNRCRHILNHCPRCSTTRPRRRECIKNLRSKQTARYSGADRKGEDGVVHFRDFGWRQRLDYVHALLLRLRLARRRDAVSRAQAGARCKTACLDDMPGLLRTFPHATLDERTQTSELHIPSSSASVYAQRRLLEEL